MAETFKCPHCSAVYDVKYGQVCGRQMSSTHGSSIPRYELIKMPDGTNV